MILKKVLDYLSDILAGMAAILSIIPALLFYALGVFVGIVAVAFKEGYYKR